MLVAEQPIPITVERAGTDRRTRREQIDQTLIRAADKKEPVRVRLPFTMYDYGETRGYVYLRDAAWNLQLPLALTTPEVIEELINTLGVCVGAIAAHGSQAVQESLRRLDQTLEQEPEQ